MKRWHLNTVFFPLQDDGWLRWSLHNRRKQQCITRRLLRLRPWWVVQRVSLDRAGAKFISLCCDVPGWSRWQHSHPHSSHQKHPVCQKHPGQRFLGEFGLCRLAIDFDLSAFESKFYYGLESTLSAQGEIPFSYIRAAYKKKSCYCWKIASYKIDRLWKLSFFYVFIFPSFDKTPSLFTLAYYYGFKVATTKGLIVLKHWPFLCPFRLQSYFRTRGQWEPSVVSCCTTFKVCLGFVQCWISQL